MSGGIRGPAGKAVATEILTMAKRTGKKAFLRFLSRIYPVLVISALGFIVYSNSFDCSFHFDDRVFITENPSIRDIRDIRGMWNFLNRRFIGTLTFALNRRFNGSDVFGYHLVNLLVHVAASILVWRLTMLLFMTPVLRRERYAGWKNPIALGCALLFLVHPVQTQAVTYIVQRYASLAGMFYLAALTFHLKARLSRGSVSTFYFVLSGCSALLGIFTKETLMTFPPAVLLLELHFFNPGGNGLISFFRSRRFLVAAIPFAAFLLVVPALLSFNPDAMFGAVESHRYGDPPLTSLVYLMTQFRVVATYVRLLFLPLGLNLDYDFPASRSFFEPSTFLSFLFLSAVLAAAIRAYPKNRLVSFGIMFFFLALSVESTVKPLHNVIFEHRLYLPMYGFCLAVFGLLARLPLEKHGKTVFGAVLAVVVVFSGMTHARNRVWKDEVTLWSDVLEKSPKKARPHYNLALAYLDRGMTAEAARHFRESLAIDPTNYRAYNNLGLVLYRGGDTENAEECFRKALALKPDFATARNNLGLVLSRTGRIEEAERQFREAISEAPEMAETHYNLGNILFREKKYEEAIKEFEKAVELDPAYSKAYNNMGLAYYRLGDFGEAKKQYMKAVETNRNYAAAYCNLGLVFQREGNYGEAERQFLEAVRINPDYADAHYKLAMCYEKQGKKERARAHLEEVKRITGRYPPWAE